MAAAGAAFGADVDDVVGAANEVEIVFDDDDAGAGIEQIFEALQQHFDVGGMQAGGGFVERRARGRGLRSAQGRVARAGIRRRRLDMDWPNAR